VIPYGIDTRIFYPRPPSDGRRSRNRRARVLVQARPSAPWRGFSDALAVFERLAERVQGVETVFFGCSDDELRGYRIRFPFQNAGVVSDRHAVARLYSSCDALLDPSRFQAFGLPGLEAMACGVPAVLPREGGCAAYAVHESNALVIPAGDVDARVAALERVLDDARLRTRLIENGLATAARFSVGEMTRRHLEVYRGAGRPAPIPQASVPG
jgi:glycosyltransferase involved in cell wall biosynthesis